jgi:hypothetical protein
MAVLWTCGNVSLSAAAIPVLGSTTAMDTHNHQYNTGTKRKGQDPSSSDVPDNSHQICNLFNSPQGCGTQKKCPNGRKHVCNFRTPRGVCGNPNHNATTHPQKKGPAKDGRRKGKGKGAKGKGKNRY